VYSNWPSNKMKGDKKVAQAIVFGLGSMFNHSTQDQNVVWERDTSCLVITYRAWRDIRAGEELCISYGSHLTFKDADAPTLLPPETELEQLNHIQID
jgi:SET domain-containing protein